MSILRLVFILIFLLLIIAFSIPIQIFCNIIGFKLKRIYPLYFYQMIKIVTGININFNKTKLNKKNMGVLYIANHVSWFDIICLGTLLNARFIAKKEVSQMGIFGFLAMLSNTFFIDNENKLSIEYIKKINSKFLAKLKNIDSVDQIKEYTNIKLYISSENLPKLKSEEVYWYDLKGMIVIGLNKNEILGEVKELNNFGANDYLIVKPTSDSVDEKERLIPFIKEKFIDSIDKKERVLKVYWQSDY